MDFMEKGLQEWIYGRWDVQHETSSKYYQMELHP